MNARYYLLVLSLPFCLQGYAAGFDCNKASSKNEILICGDSDLSELDEIYSASYKRTLKLASDNAKTRQQVKSSAVKALRRRESRCGDSECLQDWYKQGIQRLRMQTHSLQADTVTTQKPSARNLYEQLNIRTFTSILGQRLKADCATYLKDYFPQSVVKFEQNNLVIDDGDYFWEISLLDSDFIKVRNRFSDASYSTHKNLDLVYVPDTKEFRVVNPKPGIAELYIKKPASCAGSDSIHREKYPNTAFDGYEAETRSVGEFNLAGKLTSFAIPLFDAPDGAPLGSMHIRYRKNPVTGHIVHVWLRDLNERSLMVAPITYRKKYDAALLVFDTQSNWFNISPIKGKPIWLSSDSLLRNQLGTFISREEIVMQASEIKVRSAHRLRATPSLNANILEVFKPREPGGLWPLAAKGDWLKVRHVAPYPFDEDPRSIPVSSTKYLIREGWIKWKENFSKQYISVEYHYD